MPKRGKAITTAVASLAVACSFGAGAVALSKSDIEFNPGQFDSAYTRGASDDAQGYRARTNEVDAAANRQSNDTPDTDTNTSDKGIDDAFSDLPIDGQSGTTVYNLLGRTTDGLLVSTGNASAADANGGSASGSLNGIIAGRDSEGGSGTGNGDGSGNESGKGEADSGNGGGSTKGDDNNAGNGGDPQGDSFDRPQKGDEYGTGDEHPIKSNGSNSPLVNLSKEQQASIRYMIMDDWGSEYPLYEGQKLDPWTIFCALRAVYRYNDVTYYWACTYDEFKDYNFQITSYPEYASGDMTFGVRFRYSDTCDWIEDTVEYTARDYLFYVTGPWPEDGSSPDIYAKISSTDYERFPYDAYRWTESVLGTYAGEPISRLFLNWTRDGEILDDPYQIEAGQGRSVVSPTNFVDVPSGLDATIALYWMNGPVEDLSDGDDLAYLQALTSVHDDSPSRIVAPDGSSTIMVPNGFQAIHPGDEGISANKLSLPASVVRVDTMDPALRVYDAYSVADDNRVYSATADGVLQTKDGSQYCGIPLNMHSLNVNPGVKQIDLAPGNTVDTIVLQGETLDEIPNLNFEELDECNIEVRDDLFDDYIVEYHDALAAASNVTVSRMSDPSMKYRVDNGVVYNEDIVTRVLDLGQSSVSLRVPHTIETGAFDGCESVDSVVLDSDDPFVLEDGCFAGGNIGTIACKTQDQLEYVASRLDAAGAPDASVVLLDGNAQGFRWFVSANALGGQSVTLLEAPADIVDFAETITTDDGVVLNIDSIAPNAFSNCTSLRWAQLGQSTKTIGSGAFAGCESLEGVLINSPDVVNVGPNAFANCPSMGFIASNAHEGNFQTDERPNDCMMYAPTDSLGYHRYFITFDGGWGLDGFETVDVGDDCRVLYGYSSEDSFYQGDWLVLASGQNMPEQVTLPSSTVRMYCGAFANVATPFNINWNDLTKLETIDGEALMMNDAGDQFQVLGAFGNSAIAGDVHISATNSDALNIGSYAFSDCNNLESITLEGSGIWLAMGAFYNCEALSSATISNIDWYGTLENSAFSGCSNLTDIYFTADEPVALDMKYDGWAYSFLGLWFADDWDVLRIHVPEGYEEDYLNAWIYPMAGYADYDTLRNQEYWDLFEETGSEPSEGQIKKAMGEALLESENHVRIMLGMETVDKSSIIDVEQANGATFVTEDGVTQLVEIDSDAEVIDLDAIIPDSLADEGVQIMEGAFDGCPNMTTLIMSSKAYALSNNVLSGQTGVTMVIPSLEALPMLVGGDWFSPYDFACDDFHIQVPSEIQREVLVRWTYQAGMSVYDEFTLGMYVEMFYTPGDTQEEYDQQFNELFLMEPENMLRGYMGLPTVEDYRELWSFVNTADYVTAHDPDPDDDFWGDDSDWRRGAPNSSERESSANQGDAGNPGRSATSDSASADDSANADAAAADGVSNAGSESESSSVAAPLNANDGVAACARKETNMHSMP